MKPREKAYQEDLERIEQRYEGIHEMMLCDRCKREFRATVEKDFTRPKEWICPMCLEDADIF